MRKAIYKKTSHIYHAHNIFRFVKKYVVLLKIRTLFEPGFILWDRNNALNGNERKFYVLGLKSIIYRSALIQGLIEIIMILQQLCKHVHLHTQH